MSGTNWISPPPPSATPAAIAAISSCGGAVRRYQLATAGLVEREPRGREPDRTRLDRFLGKRSHAREVLRRGRFPIGAALSHHVDPQRRMRQISGDVDVTLSRRDASMNSGKVSQSHGSPSTMTTPGMSSTPAIRSTSTRDRPRDTARSRRRSCPSRGGHAVMRRRGHPVRPDRLAVVVGMHIDEAGRHQQPGRVDFGAASPRTVPTATIMPSDTATSPTYGSPPRPSTIVPPLISRSKVITGLYGGVGRSCQDVAVIDHFGINCANLETAKAFYDQVLGVPGTTADGLRRGHRRTARTGIPTSGSPTATTWVPIGRSTWRSALTATPSRRSTTPPSGSAPSRCTSRGCGPSTTPAISAQLGRDPDGNNVEAVCHAASMAAFHGGVSDS